MVASVLADAQRAGARPERCGDAVRARVRTCRPRPGAARLAALCAESGGDAVRAVLFFGSRKTGAAPDP